MANLEPYADRIAKICEQWNLAERDIKLAEQIENKVVLPAIQELRYAGRRLIEALDKIERDAPQDEIDGLLQDAEFDCLRARHDSIDAATSTISLYYDIVVEKIGFRTILTVIPNFTDLLQSLTTINQKIAEARKDRLNREIIYAAVEEIDFVSLIEQFNIFKQSEQIMIKIASREREKLSISYFFGFCGFVALVLSLFGFFK